MANHKRSQRDVEARMLVFDELMEWLDDWGGTMWQTRQAKIVQRRIERWRAEFARECEQQGHDLGDWSEEQ